MYVHPPTMWCRVLCRDCFPLPEVWGVSTSAEMKISDIGLLIIHVGMRLYSNCHHGSTVIFCCYLLLCVEQLQFLSPTETSGSLSNVSARSLASVQRLALRQEMNKTSCVCVCVCVYIYIYIYSPWRNNPSGPGPPHCRSFAITLRHTTHHSAGRGISPTQKPLPDNCHNRQWDSNPQSQQASGLWGWPH